jgi:AcrR family transcriptional regulator
MARDGSTLSVPRLVGSDPRRTREKILDCAADLYSHHGYGEGSIRNIADRIGIRGPSLYHHFSSKEELTLDLVRIAAAEAYAALEPVSAIAFTTAPEALLDAAIEAHLRTLFHPKRYLAALLRIYSEVPPELREATTAALAPYLGGWMGILRHVYGKAPVRPEISEVHVFFIFGAVNSIVEWHYGRRAELFSLDDLRVILRDMLLRGLGPGSPRE